jgi:hypothetical protein
MFVADEIICRVMSAVEDLYMGNGDYSHRRNEHEPVVASQCLHNDSPAVEPTCREKDREDRQRYFDAQNEGTTRNRVNVVRRRPFDNIFECWEG